MMTAGPAPLTPVPIVVKMPPPIIVPSPMAMRSLAVNARRRILRLPSSRSLTTLVVAKSRDVKDIERSLRSKAGPNLGLGAGSRDSRRVRARPQRD